MKVKFWCDNGANIHSERKETFDIGKYYSDWENYSEEEKYEVVKEWMWEKLEYGFEEVE